MARASDKSKTRAGQSPGLVYPSTDRRLIRGSILAGSLVVVGALGLYAVGARQTLSPGDTASAHARIDLKCAQCHDPGKGVESVRCERCHDPSASGRLEHLTHIGPKAAASQKAGSADTVACSRCHQDHLGRTASLTKVNDLECGSCHGFGSFGGHPEVALVEKRVPPRDPGLEFNHDRHITEVETKRGAMCETCHEQTANRRGFEPIDFDRHCASCHARQGTLSTDTDFVPAGMLVMPEDVPASFRIMNRPRLEVNARGRVKASGLRHRDGWVLFNAGRLRRGIAPEAEASERAALLARISYLEQLRLAPQARLVRFQDREAAIAELQAELAALDQESPGEGPGDAAALQQMTSAAETLLASLPTPDQPAPRAPAADFEARRAELLRLLDAIDARLGVAGRVKVDALRQRVLATRQGGMAADENLRARKDRRRRLDHLLLEQELDLSPRDREDAPAVNAARDLNELGALTRKLQLRLADLERTIDMEPSASESDREARSNALESLLTPCRVCHTMDADRSRLAPVLIGDPILSKVRFNHAPHTRIARCELCHAAARTSKGPADPLAPSIVTCQKCHQPSQVKAACGTCHLYHPPAQLTAELP